MVKEYKAQALAMVLIVLVVSLVIGVAMLSRTLKDTKRVADEKSSAEALEFSDSVIDVFKGTSIDTLESVCEDDKYGEGLKSEGGCSVAGIADVKEFLTEVGVNSDSVDVFETCNNDNSNLSVSASVASAEDDLEIRPDSVRSFVLRGQSPSPASCTLDLEFEPRGASMSGVMVSKVYAKNYTDGIPAEYKVYGFDDISQYCIHNDDVDCADSSTMVDNWTPIEVGDKLSISLSAVGGFDLDEIRVRSLGGVVSLKSSLSDPDCVQGLEMIKIVVAANCTGSYRAKEVQIPQKDWALSIFDYVLFNGNGSLGPDITEEE